MIEYYYKTAKDETFTPLTAPKEGCWIHVDEAVPADLEQICQLTGLEYTDLQDSLDRYEVPRIEKIRNNFLLFARHPVERDVAIGLYTTTLTILLTPHYAITISPLKNPIIHTFLNKKGKIATSQHLKFAISLLMHIAHEFAGQTRRIRYNVLTQEKEMINVESDEITLLTRHEEVLNQYLSSLEPMSTVIQEIVSGRYINLLEKDQDLLEDLLNAVTQSETLCAIAVKSIRGLRDSYQIIFTNNLHKTIKLLTSLTILFSIPTMIASIYGMNVGLPFAKGAHAFLIILTTIFGLSIIAFIFFRRKRWL